MSQHNKLNARLKRLIAGCEEIEAMRPAPPADVALAVHDAKLELLTAHQESQIAAKEKKS